MISDVKNRSPILKQLFDGRPSVLIRKGKLMENEFRRARISVEEFLKKYTDRPEGSLLELVLKTTGDLRQCILYDETGI